MMVQTDPSGLSIIRSELLSGIPKLIFGMSTRTGGVSPGLLGMNTSFNVGDREENVRENRFRFISALGISTDRIVIPRQVHSNTIRIVTEPGTIDHCDGLITAVSGLFLSVSVADCLPIILVDSKSGTLAVVHAGWRGSCSGVVSAAIGMMRKEFHVDPADLYCYIGPGARSCCYEVGEDVARRFDEPFVLPKVDGKYLLDLPEYNEGMLVREGVQEKFIEVSEKCTICSPEMLHSYRRDGARSGRMMAIAGFL